MKRVIVGSVVGAIVYFFWGAFSWMVLPWHNATMKSLPQEEQTMIELKSDVPESGAYYFPAMPHGNYTDEQLKVAEDAFMERHKKGPIGMLFYCKEGMDPMSSSSYVRALGFNFIAALIISLLLSKTSLNCYRCRVAFVAGMGLFGGVVSYLSLWNWMHFPLDYCAVMTADLLAGWLVAGLVIAAIVKPKTVVS